MKSIYIGGRRFRAKAVGFDKDGTLFDAVAYWRYIDRLRLREFIAVAGPEIASEWTDTMGFRAPDRVDYDGVLALATTQEEIILIAGLLYRRLRWPWPKCKQAAEGIFANADKRMIVDEAFQPVGGFPDVIPMLRAHGLNTGIMTSDSMLRTKACMEAYEVLNQLDFMITPEQVKRGKPDPDMVLKACSDLGISPSEMIVVGDSVVDMKMAKSAGSLAVGIITHRGSADTLSSEADIVIESLLEIQIP